MTNSEQMPTPSDDERNAYHDAMVYLYRELDVRECPGCEDDENAEHASFCTKA